MSRPEPADATAIPGGEMRPDILARINEREQLIERILQQEHAAAGESIAKARRAAAELIEARRAEADRVAADAGEKALALARREADAIREAAAAEAAALLGSARGRIALAADRLLSIVLPKPPGAGAEP